MSFRASTGHILYRPFSKVRLCSYTGVGGALPHITVVALRNLWSILGQSLCLLPEIQQKNCRKTSHKIIIIIIIFTSHSLVYGFVSHLGLQPDLVSDFSGNILGVRSGPSRVNIFLVSQPESVTVGSP